MKGLYKMRPIEIDTFQKMAGLGQITISDDTKCVAFLRTHIESNLNGYAKTLGIYDTNQERIRWFPDISADGIYWRNEDELIYFKSHKQNDIEFHTEFWCYHIRKNEKFFLCRIPFQEVSIFGKTGDGIFLIKATVNQRNHLRLEGLSPKEREAELDRMLDENSRFTIYDEYPYYWNGRGIINGMRTSVYRLNIETGDATPVFPVGFQIENAVYSKEDGIIAATGFGNQRVRMYKEALMVAREDGKEWRKLVDQEIFRIERLAVWNHRIVMTVNMEKKGSGQHTPTKLVWVHLEDGSVSDVIPEPFFIGNPVLSDVCPGYGQDFLPWGEWLYYIQGDEESSYLMRMNLSGKRERVTEEQGSVFCFDVKEDTVYFIAALGAGFQELYTVKGCGIQRISELNTWIANEYDILPLESVNFLCDENIEIHGFVIKPAGFDPSKKYPLILDIHGGPGMAYGTGFMHEMQYWAAQGYFVAFCNPRGSASRGAAFFNIFGRFGTKDYDDLMKFTDVVLEKYKEIDPAKIGVTGGSYGGYATNWIIGHTDRFAAAASQRSISNMLTMDGASHCAGYLCEEWTHATGWTDIEQVWKLAPLAYAKNVKTPTLFLQSDEDYICPVIEAQQMFTAVIQNGVEAKMVIFKGENHALSRNGRPKNRIKRIQEITDWMDRFLKA